MKAVSGIHLGSLFFALTLNAGPALSTLSRTDRKFQASIAFMETTGLIPTLDDQAKGQGLRLQNTALVVDMTCNNEPIGYTFSLLNVGITLRNLSDDAAWSTVPALGRHLRDCALRRLQHGFTDQLLVECRHYDNKVRDPDEFAVFYISLRVFHDSRGFVSADSNDLNLLNYAAGIVEKRSRLLLLRKPKYFPTYWRKGQMVEDVERAVRVFRGTAQNVAG